MIYTSIDSIQRAEKTRNGFIDGICSYTNKSIKYSQEYEF